MMTEWLEKLWRRLGFLIEESIGWAGEKAGEKVPTGRPMDTIATHRRMSRDLQELYQEYMKLSRYESQAVDICNNLCWEVVGKASTDTPALLDSPILNHCHALCMRLLAFEGYHPLPTIDFTSQISLGETWELTTRTRRQLEFFEKPNLQQEIAGLLAAYMRELLPNLSETVTDGIQMGEVELVRMHPDVGGVIDWLNGYTVKTAEQNGLFHALSERLRANFFFACGIDPERDDPERSSSKVVPASSRTDKSPEELAAVYLYQTPFVGFFKTRLPFTIPHETRFSHTHIVAGSGHGKTQLMQKMILQDFALLREGQATVVVIDSQGDMFHSISQLQATGEISNRVVIIDPTEIDYPPALNLFDFGLERANTYSRLAREMLVNGAIDLCEYMFGALLEADLTPQQSVIFRNLARLMLGVPNATIETLRDFLLEPEKAVPYIDTLEGNAREFFKKQFFSHIYDQTRMRILTRIFGVLGHTTLERMFCNKRNKVNIYEAMNQGSLILINTAKDLLKQDGTEILGRFFIALICQAAQERAAIGKGNRMPTFVYIDEAHDYFDENVARLLEQARKYSVGLVLAHQFLDQLGKIRSSVVTNTAIKLVGGLSANDARALSQDMRTTPDYLLSMTKDGEKKQTQFACFVKNLTKSPITLTIPLGTMENEPVMNREEQARLREQSRLRVCDVDDESDNPPPTSANGQNPDDPELL